MDIQHLIDALREFKEMFHDSGERVMRDPFGNIMKDSNGNPVRQMRPRQNYSKEGRPVYSSYGLRDMMPTQLRGYQLHNQEEQTMGGRPSTYQDWKKE